MSGTPETRSMSFECGRKGTVECIGGGGETCATRLRVSSGNELREFGSSDCLL